VADAAVAEQVEIQAKYEGYVSRQRDEVQRRVEQEEQRLPADLDFASVRGLSKEVQQILQRVRPETLGQASRLSGVTPAAIALLQVHLKRAAAPQKKRA
jgi:tRNA uridine 5-carboxymethylaminomethyl modification enzyme